MIEETGYPEAALVVVDGEIDVEEAPRLEEFALSVVAANERSGLVIDMGGVEFIGSPGLTALLEVQRTVAADGGWVHLRNPSRSVLRVLEVTGLGEDFLRSPPLSEADDTG